MNRCIRPFACRGTLWNCAAASFSNSMSLGCAAAATVVAASPCVCAISIACYTNCLCGLNCFLTETIGQRRSACWTSVRIASHRIEMVRTFVCKNKIATVMSLKIYLVGWCVWWWFVASSFHWFLDCIISLREAAEQCIKRQWTESMAWMQWLMVNVRVHHL